MRLLALLVMIIGVALGGGAAYYAWKFAGEQRMNTLRPEFETVRILVAKKKLEPGDRVETGQLAWAEWPTASVPSGAFSRVEVLLGDKGELYRIATRTIEPGEPVLESKVSEPGGRNFIEAALPPGMRAFSIPIDSVTGVSGFVNPGDRVDVMLIHSAENAMVSQIILSNVMILATDQSTNSEIGGARLARTVTVAVTTGDAQRLSLAMAMGKLSLMLRGIGPCADEPPTAPLDSRSLNRERPEATPERSVTVRRAGQTEKVRIE